MTVQDNDARCIPDGIEHLIAFLQFIQMPTRLCELVFEVTFSDASNAPLRDADNFNLLDRALFDLVDRCPVLDGIFVEVIVKGAENIREDAFPTIISVLFPQLYSKHMLTFRPARKDVCQWSEL